MTLTRICLSTSCLVWSVALLYFYTSGRIDNYLSESLRIYSLIGGLLLAILGIFNLMQREAKACNHCDSGHHHDHEHDHDHGGTELPAPLALILMIIPLGLSCLYTVDDFSSAVLIRKGLFDDSASQSIISSKPPPSFTLEQFEKTTPKTKDGFFQIQLIDLYFASNDAELREIFQQSPIQLTGQVAIEDENITDELRIYRLFITCCNADARPIAVRVKVENSSAWQDQQWVSIKGRVKFEIREGIPIPIIESTRIEATNKPEESWLN